MLRLVKPRQLLREKRIAAIGLRIPPELKACLEKRAAQRETTLSKHMLNVAVADLERQARTGKTLLDTAGALNCALELAKQGIENDQQRMWVLKRLTRFQAAVLEETA